MTLCHSLGIYLGEPEMSAGCSCASRKEGRKGEEMVTALGHELSHLVLRKTSSQFQRVQRPHQGDKALCLPPSVRAVLNPKTRMANVSRAATALITLHVSTLDPHNDVDVVLFIVEGKELRHT